MSSKQIFLILLSVIVLVRMFVMVVFPLTDTTEARYANMALIMATSGDWITPYFDVGIPFWGKPPLSFWAAAASYEVFGVFDVVPRIPSLIFSLMTAWLIYHYLKTFYAKDTAYWGVLIYLSTALVFILSGAVLTDPFLVFATTLSMVAFIMVVQKQSRYWNHLFFVGLGLGLLTKGPLVFVLVGGALTLWLMFDYKRWHLLKQFSWLTGLFIVAVIALPWYVIAELKTPGFIDYFIVGEHFMRFVDSGWKGDMYGTAHKEPKGFIWLMWLGAAIPFSFIALGLLVKHAFKVSGIKQMVVLVRQHEVISYFVAWSLLTMIFFTISANVLATYVLPALPAFSILLAIYIASKGHKLALVGYNTLYPLVLFVPVFFLFAGSYFMQHEQKLPTEKNLIAYYQQHQGDSQGIYYINSRPFSAQYYSGNKAVLVELSPRAMKHSLVMQWQDFLQQVEEVKSSFHIVVASDALHIIPEQMKQQMVKQFESKRYILFKYSKK
ncbi:MAG: glycosyltransferase family 39 protein [Ghiorsea sp.]|nr:glycosyltransferase family 39 protein [Ghiorsea sp.]